MTAARGEKHGVNGMTQTDPNTATDLGATIGDIIAEAQGGSRENTTPAKTEDVGQIFRHAGWDATRGKVRTALARAGTGKKALERFDECGRFARVYYSPTEDRFTLRASYCHNRHCRPCATAKAAMMARNLRTQLSGNPVGRYRFITLTIEHSNKPLDDQLKKLLVSYAKLRRTKLFKSQKGGAYFLEVKIGEDDRWHPHLHLVTEGYFIAQRELSDAWRKITGGSYVVDVRAVPDAAGVSHELTKYIAKGTSRNVWDNIDRAIEWILTSKSTRTCGTFGTWRDFKITQVVKTDDDFVCIGTLTDVHARATAGDLEAQHILWCLFENQPPNELTRQIISPAIPSG